MTPSDEIAERDVDAAWKHTYKVCETGQIFDRTEAQKCFIAGMEYCMETRGTFDQAIELLRSEEAMGDIYIGNVKPDGTNGVIKTAFNWADWLQNNKPRGVG